MITEEQEAEYEKLVKKSQPTDKQVADRIKSSGWMTFDDMRYDHLDEDEAEKLRTAVSRCREYTEDIKADKTPSLMLIASTVGDDQQKTGYGCGKTTLANIIHQTCHHVQFVVFTDLHVEAPEFWIHPMGKFYTSKELMSLFDDEPDDIAYKIKQFGKMLILDDVGREGSLKWESRDPKAQLQEKQNRYYTIINHCYEKKIPVVITSNFTSRELASFLGGATWSRLLQMTPEKYRINLTGIRDIRPILSGEQWF